MKIKKMLSVTLLIAVLVSPALSWSANLVVGQNLKTGMPLSEAIGVLGVPQSVVVHRGPDSALDSIEINFKNHGVKIRALNGSQTVEAIELSPAFKGSFANGLKLGDKFQKIIQLYGVPATVTSQVARYPSQGLYFLLNKDTLLAGKSFSKGTKLVHHKMMNP